MTDAQAHAPSRRRILGAGAALAGGALLARPAAATGPAPARLRVGALAFGTVAWELAALRGHGLDRAAGIVLEVVEVAGTPAGQIALRSGAVDVVTSDWIWVARQRAEGQDLTFVPYSGAVGGLVVPAGSPIRDVPDLPGRRIGIAGGPLDKGWLLLRALAQRAHGIDLARMVTPVYAAPPLLNRQAESGDLDGVLTYWHFAARLTARGHRQIVGVSELARRLGLASDVPTLGYVFREGWATANPGAVDGFIRATRRVKQVLKRDDSAWEELRPLMKAGDEATFRALRDGFRAGIPERWTDAERADAARLFAILAEVGGRDLVGGATAIPDGTFWPVSWGGTA